MPAADAELVAAVSRMSASAIRDASTSGLWNGSVCRSVRKRIRFVRCAAVAKNRNGEAEMENLGKNQCSMIA